MTPEIEPRPDEESERFRAARERAGMLQGFYIHLLVYAAVNVGLFGINVVTRGDGGSWWFYWPLLGWGIALLVHAVTTYAAVFTEDWRERKAVELYERDRRRPAA